MQIGICINNSQFAVSFTLMHLSSLVKYLFCTKLFYCITTSLQNLLLNSMQYLYPNAVNLYKILTNFSMYTWHSVCSVFNPFCTRCPKSSHYLSYNFSQTRVCIGSLDIDMEKSSVSTQFY